MIICGLQYLRGSKSPSGRKGIFCKTVGFLKVKEKVSRKELFQSTKNQKPDGEIKKLMYFSFTHLNKELIE